jgi:PKD repeat protein
MKNHQPTIKTRFLAFQIIIILFLGGISSLKASHIMGGEINYRLIDTTNGKYKIRLTVYRDCAGIDYATEYIKVGTSSGTTQVTLNFKYKEEVSQICKVPDVAITPTTNCPRGPIGAIMGVEKWVYEVDYVIGKNIGYAYVGWTSCCRNHAITTIQNPGGENSWLQALINTDYKNNSLTFANIPFKYLFKNEENIYNPAGVDSFDDNYIMINGKQIVLDSIAFELYTPFNNSGNSVSDIMNFNNSKVNFNTGLNTQNFLYTTTGVKFNPNSGEIKMTPSMEQTAVYAIAAFEYRAIADASQPAGYRRVLVGHITRDIQFAVISAIGMNRNLKVDSVKNVVCSSSDSSYVFTILGKNKGNKIFFNIKGNATSTIKYKIISTPASTDLSAFNMTITGLNSNKLTGLISFDTVKTANTELYVVIETYDCMPNGIKHIKSHTITINTQGFVSCQLKCDVSRSKDSLLCTPNYGIPPYKYKWSNGDTTHFRKAFLPGTYFVTVTDSSGCQSKCSYYITSPCDQFKNFSWKFSDTSVGFKCDTDSSGYIISYLWDFGNGITSVIAKPTIKYSINGIYTVKLHYCLRDSNQNIICCDSIVKYVAVTHCKIPCNVKANFNWTLNSNLGTVNFADLTTPGFGQMYTYFWSFGNGHFSTQKNPIVHYTAPGTYKVCLVVARWLNLSNRLCIDSICKNITITNINPCNRLIPDFTWSASNGSYQFTNTTNLSNFTVVSLNYKFSTGHNYSTSNTNHTFLKNGNYSVTLNLTVFDVLTGTTCTKSITKHIVVNTSVCGCLRAMNTYTKSGMTTSFTNRSVCADTTVTYLYKFGNGASSTSPNPVYIYSLPGLYRVVMSIERTIGATTCRDSFIRIIQINTSNACFDSGYIDKVNSSCGAYINPVCGCNGITYLNACEATKAGVKQYTVGPCSNDPDWSKICGYVYHDLNKNCGFDSSDQALKSIKIKLNSSPIRYTYTNTNGYYEFWVLKGSYDVEQILSNYPGLGQLCPGSPKKITVNATSALPCNHNFYDTANKCQDLSVTIHRNLNITPGFTSMKTITYKNNTAHTVYNVKIHYRFLTGLAVKSSTTGNYTVSGNVITWNLGHLLPYHSGFKHAYFLTPITMALGTTVIDSVWIEPTNDDCNLGNNSHTYKDTCVGSWDPNDKSAAQPSEINLDTKIIDYHIRFQNTGTAPAHNVVIEDQIDSKLDYSSMVIHEASHKYQAHFNDNGKIYFEFENIMLPDSGTDYEASQGYVGYSVKLHDNLPVGSEIKNTAGIYFDFNEPVITNTTMHTIVLKTSSGIQNIGKEMNISIYPNPTQDIATMHIKLDKETRMRYTVHSINGKTILESKEKVFPIGQLEETIDFSPLSSGIYILNISVNDQTTSLKIVKQ